MTSSLFFAGMPNQLSVMKKKYPETKHQLTLGSNIRKWRGLKNVKQKDLAGALGLSEAAVSNIENDKTSLSVQQLGIIATALDIPVLHLFTDPLRKIPSPIAIKEQRLTQHEHASLLDSLLTVIEKKDKKFWAMLLKIKHRVDEIVAQRR